MSKLLSNSYGTSIFSNNILTDKVELRTKYWSNISMLQLRHLDLLVMLDVFQWDNDKALWRGLEWVS